MAPVRTIVTRVIGLRTELVADQLAKLVKRDQRWRVLHSIPVGERGSDIDHLVIGPAGVFTLNAKHHPEARIWVAGDAVRVNGHAQPYVRNSRHEAVRAGRLLTAATGREVSAHGVVVPVGADSLTIKEQPRDVSVVARSGLVAWLLALPETLTGPCAAVIYDAARRPEVWSTPVR